MRPLVLLALLAACGAPSPRVTVQPPPPSLTQPCLPPVPLSGAMSQLQVEGAWGSDRRELRDCAGKQAGLAAWAQGVVEVFQ